MVVWVFSMERNRAAEELYKPKKGKGDGGNPKNK